MGKNTVELDFDNFDEQVLESDIPVVVDFWAEWCGPCKTVSKVIEELADEFDGQVRVGKVDIDENTHLANDHQIKAIPTLIFFHKGNVLRRVTGASSKTELKDIFDQIVEVAEEGE
ncbi:MAG: thioredoxin [Myxococcota bacterium]